MRFLMLILAVAQLAVIPLSSHADPRNRCLSGRFKGITETSPDGTLIGRVDKFDWGCIAAADLPVPLTSPAGGIPPLPPPDALCLQPAAPNPVPGGQVRLMFTLPVTADVELAIYQQTRGVGPPTTLKVITLLEGTHVIGVHEVLWDLRDPAGFPVPSGIYRAVLQFGTASLCGDIEVVR
jgi:hypothetical protein